MLEQRGQVRTEDRRARVAVLESAEFGTRGHVAAPRTGTSKRLHRQPRQVALWLLEQREHEVFDVDLVVSAGHAKARSALGGHTRRVVELADQGLEVRGHERSAREVAVVSMERQQVVAGIAAVFGDRLGDEKAVPAEARRLERIESCCRVTSWCAQDQS